MHHRRTDRENNRACCDGHAVACRPHHHGGVPDGRHDLREEELQLRRMGEGALLGGRHGAQSGKGHLSGRHWSRGRDQRPGRRHPASRRCRRAVPLCLGQDQAVVGEARRDGRECRQGRHLRDGCPLFLRGGQMPCRGLRGRDPARRHLSGRERAGVARNAHRGRRDREHAEVGRLASVLILLLRRM